MIKPTVHDIARHAGVSLATVDRVLNARPGVREGTVARVQAAIDDLGYVRDMQAANLARGRQYRFAFVLPEAATAFLTALHAEVAGAVQRARAERIAVAVHTVPAFDPEAAVAALSALEGVDGVAVWAPESDGVRAAVARLRAAGVVVVTLISDLTRTDRDHFAGINNLAAGRTAAVLMGRFLGPRAGSVAVVTGSRLAHDHAERRAGFDAVMAAKFGHLRVLPAVEVRDRSDAVATLLPALFRDHPDVVGVYATGEGHQGLVRVLSAGHLAARPVVVGHELTDAFREALAADVIDAVIHQDVGHIVRSCLRVLRARADGMPIVAAQERIRIDIILKENLQ